MRALASLLLPLLLAAPGSVLANGRAPLTNGVHFAPGDNHSLYVASTFGLLISHDDGCTFDWVCEQAVGYNGTFDPKYALAADGSIYATTFTGLHISRDGGCSFEVATAGLPVDDPGNFSQRWVDALDIGPTGEVWAGLADSGHPNDFFSSTDGGHTFASKGLLSSTIWWKSVKVSPADARRVYVTGYQVSGTLPDGGSMQPQAHLLRSDDDGATWNPSALGDVHFGTTPIVLVSAIDPTDKDKLFVTSLGAGSAPGPGDRLYVSTDGGATLTEALSTADTIRDVVIVDGTHVLAATENDGTYASTDGGHTFAKETGTPQLECLGRRADGKLFGCGQNWAPDFKAVAQSADGATWDKVFRFVELAGPLACPAGTAEHDVCAPTWPTIQQQFGATGSTCGLAPDGPAADAPVPPPKASAGGCCDAGSGSAASLLFGLGVGALLLRRRRA